MKEWFLTLQPRERRLVGIAAVLAVIIVVYGLILTPLGRATAHTAESVAKKEIDLAWMQRAAIELRETGGQSAVTPEGGSLVVIIDRTTRAHGLAGALASSQPTGADGIRVRFDNAPFDTLVEWLGRLQAEQGVLIRSASVDAASQAGRVNASLILERPTS